MSTFTKPSKSSTPTWATTQESTGGSGTSGSPIGILLSLTYTGQTSTSWNKQSKSS